MNPTPAGGENNLVVARYRNGEVVKGYTRDFFPDRASFHVLPKGGQVSIQVRTPELKGVFFVRDLVGNRLRNKGRRIAVLFEDGELLVGYAQTYSADRTGFFVFPADPYSNNLRVYVLRAATKQVKLGPAADELAATAPPPRQKPKAA